MDIHIADLHIGAVPAEFILDAARRLPSGRVFIIGDIFHYKTRYSPADIMCFEELLRIFSGREVIITCGNHDCVVGSPEIADCLLPLLGETMPDIDFGDPVMPPAKTAPREGVRYLRRSGVYELTPRVVVVSPWREDIKGLEQYAAGATLLYHGGVEGMPWATPIITVDFMAKFARCMLGDIHRSFIGANYAYSGSLVQQNLGEDHPHGYIQWDGNVPKFVDLMMPRIFVSVDVAGRPAAEVCAEISALPDCKALRTRLRGDNVPAEVVSAMVMKYGRVDVVSCARREVDKGIIAEKLRGALNGLPAEEIEKTIAHFTAEAIDQRQASWWPKSMTWGNYGKYGESRIDFTGGITGITAPNCAGKSTIFDIFVLAMFNHCLRGDVKNMIRRGETSAHVEVLFSADGEDWLLQRVDGVRCQVSLSRAAAPAKPAPSNVVATYQRAAALVGDIRAFLRTSMMSGVDLFSEPPKARSEILPSILGLKDCSGLIRSVGDAHKAVRGQIAALTKPRGVYVDTACMVAELTRLRTLEESLRGEIAKIDGEIAAKQGAFISLTASQIPEEIGGAPADPATVAEWNELRAQLPPRRSLPQGMPVGQPSMSLVDALRKSQGEKFAEHAEAVQSKYLGMRLTSAAEPAAWAGTLDELYAAASEPVRRGDGALKFADGCSACTHNSTLLSGNEGQVMALRARFNAEVARLDEAHARWRKWVEFQEWNEARGVIGWYAEKYARLAELEKVMAGAEEHRRCTERIAQRAAAIASDAAKREVAELSARRAQLGRECAEAARAEARKAAEIAETERENKICAEYAAAFPPLDIEERRLRGYLSVLKSNGFREAIISHHLTELTRHANAALGEFANFYVEVEINESGVSFIVCDGNRADVAAASGFQRCAVALAYRLAIGEIYLTAGRFLMIDEGFASVDGENMRGVSAFLRGIAEKFHFITIISHHPDMMAVFDKCIGIAEVNGIARIGEVKKTEPADMYACPCGKRVKNTVSAITAHRKTKQHIKGTSV
jgi:hypothetical protein